jgi:hypothetical protein
MDHSQSHGRKNTRMSVSLLGVIISVLNHGDGVCADPGKRDTTLGVGDPGPPGKDDEQQLVSDSGGGET